MNALAAPTQPISSIGNEILDFLRGLSTKFPKTEISVRYDAALEANQPQTDVSSSGPLRAILDTLDNLRSVEASRGRHRFAQSPTDQAFLDAQAFAECSQLNVAPLPEVYLAADGEINFLWKQGGIHIDLGFYGNGTFSYYAEDKGGSSMYGDDLHVSGGIPEELLGLFRV